MTYYGDSISDAARAQERAQERALNLALANRDFLARERARQDAIDESNAHASQSAYMQALGLEQADRTAQANMALALSDRQYGRDLTDYQTRLGLSEAEKGRNLQRELYGLRDKQQDEKQQTIEDRLLHNDIAKRIEAGNIPDIPNLQDAESGRLSSADWVDLKTRLGQHQSRMGAEEDIGPDAAARTATEQLQSDPSYLSAEDEASKRLMMNSLFNTLSKSPVYRGKIVPDYMGGQFKPVKDYRHSIPRDAVDWYSDPLQKPSTINPATDYGGAIGMDTTMPSGVESVNPRVARVRQLVMQGIPYAEAVARVRAGQ